jgi:hypothetical protein
MSPTLRIGRISGVEIGVNWSWLIIFGLLVWTLAANVFPAQNPDLGDAAYAAMALVAAVLFFVSLLLHELGHAFQARRDVGRDYERVRPFRHERDAALIGAPRDSALRGDLPVNAVVNPGEDHRENECRRDDDEPGHVIPALTPKPLPHGSASFLTQALL